MYEDTNESIKSCIESAEGILHKRCEQLRELIFMNDNYDPSDILTVTNDIRLLADIIIAQSKKLNHTT